MTTFERDANTLELPWPFTGREDELELIRGSVATGRPGLVVTGPAGCGKTRLALQAVRGTDWARVTGTPAARRIPFAAFAHLLPGTVSLHRAVRLLSGVRLLLVDDAHLLDDASAALVHQLAVQGRTRLLVVASDEASGDQAGGPGVPDAVSRLWTGELLPRLALAPLPREETTRLMAAGTAGAPDALTADRLHRLCGGDLRLLRDLLGALRDQGLTAPDTDTGEWAWRGPLPLTATVRERAARVLDTAGAEDRRLLEHLAFAEPLPPHTDAFDLRLLEQLEAEGLITVDEHGAVRLAHPLHGAALRAAAGRLRALRLARTPQQCQAALSAEQRALAALVARADVRSVPAPVGDWLVDQGARIPAGYAAVRASLARLRGELRDAAAWARQGLRSTPGDQDCRAELALATAQSADTAPTEADGARVATWQAVARGDVEGAVRHIDEDDPYSLHDAVRLDAVRADETPARIAGRLRDLGHGLFARHADALAHGDGAALDRAAEALAERGFLLFAAEAHAQAVRAHRDPRAARTSRIRALALARRCQGPRTPALAGLVLGELTARQRQIVTLAAAGLSNRQIAERLTLSVRTVGNHLHSAYTRLGAGDRGALPCLVEQPA
ncbi:helix-turn-helix transcriptional regulator [Streptomyces naganishii JCM 4654]|uniref:Helix-turn-helix transcriptional regulator n=1 Tax=Streptomyces naganishii JCM 4654 TaxID=1306179 RepID=A0A918Y243_9ACTN|nr:LuxR C-terminal-related transcriptional regulator [Streptomyces naganishii]GHD87849.1 helix-turn-helix transcriptional regulator [Streptomyces naganishii JCM 4654]